MVKQKGVYYPESSWGSFSPKWMKKYEEGLAQPPGDKWLRENKFRRIREKLAEKFRDATHCMETLDRAKTGILDRREVAVGLFKMGIWLHPKELTAFMGVLDRNRDRSVGRDEISYFWKKYAPDELPAHVNTQEEDEHGDGDEAAEEMSEHEDNADDYAEEIGHTGWDDHAGDQGEIEGVSPTIRPANSLGAAKKSERFANLSTLGANSNSFVSGRAPIMERSLSASSREDLIDDS